MRCHADEVHVPARPHHAQAQKAVDSAKAAAERTNQKAEKRAALLALGVSGLARLAADPQADLTVPQLKGAIIKL
eukprot:4123323-Prymnesium_polylepis.1